MQVSFLFVMSQCWLCFHSCALLFFHCSLQLFNEVNSRELEKINVLKGLGRNFIFLAIIAVCTIFQVVLVQYLGKFASTAPLTLAQFVACIALASIAMPVAAFVKTLPVPKTTPSQVILNAVYPPEEEKKES